MQYVALLRGINVGGNNIITMADLKRAFEHNGFHEVKTFIQSGNVVFNTNQGNAEEVRAKIENFLAKTFGYAARIVLLTKTELEDILAAVPAIWKSDADIRCYIAYIRKPLTATEVAAAITPNPEIDTMEVAGQAVYMTTVQSGLSKSSFVKLVGKKVYTEMTIRNYVTSKKIAELMNGTLLVR